MSSPPNKSLILLLASTACFMVILDTTIVNVAIGSLQVSFQASLSGLQWVVDGYGLTFASLLLSAGALADRVGPRRAFAWGLGIFSLASLICGLAGSLEMLVVARGAQGAGAALLIPTSLSLISRTFTETNERTRALAIWGGIGGGVAMVAGPLLGGALTGWFGWRSVFLVNVPVGLLGLAMFGRIGRDEAPTIKRGLDLAGQALAVVTLSAATFFFIEGPSTGWTKPSNLVAAAVAVIGALGFLTVESRSDEPMLPLGLFRIREFSLASGIGLGLNFAFYGQLFFLNVYLQQRLGLSPAQAGFRFLPETLGGITFAMLGGRYAHLIAPRTVVILGTAFSAIGMTALATIGLRGNPWLDGMLLVTVGMAIGTPASIIAVMLGGVPSERAGVASGALNAARQTGGLLGVAVLGAIVGHSNDGVRTALVIAAGIMALGCAAAISLKRSFVPQHRLAEAAAEAMG